MPFLDRFHPNFAGVHQCSNDNLSKIGEGALNTS